MKKAFCLGATLMATVATGAASGQYVQLADLPTINGGDGTILISGTIVGDTGYAMLSGSGLQRIVKIEDLGGANTVTTLTSTVDLNAALGEVPSGVSGTLLASGTDLIILENTTDQIVKIDQVTGAASLLVDDTTLDSLPGVSSPATVSFGDVNPTTGNVFFYEGDTDSVYEVTGTNALSVVLTDTELASITGDDTPGGLGVDSSGVLYLGQSSGTENVSFFDPSDDSSGTLIVEGDVLAAQGSGTDIGISSTAFTVLSDGTVVFANTGTPDNLVSFDPSAPVASLDIVLSEAELLAGPAMIDAAIAISEFDGQVAWFNLSAAGSGVPGIYAVPEPTTAALLGLGGLAMLRRRSA